MSNVPHCIPPEHTPPEHSLADRLRRAEAVVRRQALYITQLEVEHRTMELALGIDCPPAVTRRLIPE